MPQLDPYLYIILASVIIILSFLYNAVSEKTNIPAVLMLILTGALFQAGITYWRPDLKLNLQPLLELTGIVGLIMIVLEAALDLQIRKEKLPQIINALAVAFLGLILSSFSCGLILWWVLPDLSFLTAMLYATPLSILSSAIIIPSVGNLRKEKKEFHVYESTFSDILGILQFYFLESLVPSENHGGNPVLGFFGKFFLTLAIALLASYLLIFLFQNIKAHVKLFLLTAILLLLYSIGKMGHLSSLIIILIFGLVLSNDKVFFRGWLKRKLNQDAIRQITGDFHMVTAETAFVVRTFFFVVFGMTITFSSLLNPQVVLISLAIIAAIYLVRLLIFRLLLRKDIFPQVFIGSRGLITILLFFNIPISAQSASFDSGILFSVILATNITMAVSLIIDGRKRNAKAWQPDTDAAVVSPMNIYEGFKSTLLNSEYADSTSERQDSATDPNA